MTELVSRTDAESTDRRPFDWNENVPGMHDNVARGKVKAKYGILGFLGGVIATIVGMLAAVAALGKQVYDAVAGLF